jgi:serine O-acetyltransferase
MISDLWWWLHQNPNALTTLLLRALLFVCGAHIGGGARFAGKPCFPHGLQGVYISGQAVIGQDCVIFHNVTVGSNTLADSRYQGAPTIGDHCFLGAGACVIGQMTLGDHVRIGANATVIRDVPDNHLVVSGEARVLAKDYQMDNRFRRKHQGQWQIFENGAYRPE